MRERPAHADSLDEILATAMRLFSRGVADRRSAFRTPTLATVTEANNPSLRTVVLRGFDPALRRVTIHTDQRAAKIQDIHRNPHVALHVYDQAAAIQVRLDARATIHIADAVAHDRWARTPSMSRMVYAVTAPPGSPLPAPPPAPATTSDTPENFAVLCLTFHRLEWLWLCHEAHRRAAFTWDDANQHQATWLAP